MGIETIIALGAIAASTAETGYNAKRGHDAKVQANHVADQEQAAVRDQNAKLADQQSALDATAAARTARSRQLAMLGSAGGNGSTVATSPLGLAQSAVPGGYSPLKTKLGE